MAYGGQSGEGNTATALGEGLGGDGGPPGAGDIAMAGNGGEQGITMAIQAPISGNYSGGQGGAGYFGGAKASTPAGAGSFQAGADAWPNSGAGGSGACCNQAAAGLGPGYGGSGGSGICIVTEYCWADAIDDGCGCGPTSGGARVAITGPQGWQGHGFDND